MNRQMIIERLSELREDNPDADKLYKEVLSRSVTEEGAEVQLRKIDPVYINHDFLSNLKLKPVYKSIVEYKKGNLTGIKLLKMVSSLITQILIQHENDESISTSSLQIDVLLDIINRYSKSDDTEIDTSQLDQVLERCGWIDDTKE